MELVTLAQQTMSSPAQAMLVVSVIVSIVNAVRGFTRKH